MKAAAPKATASEKPTPMWVAGAWLSTVGAVLGVAMLDITVLYGGLFTALVAAWVWYGSAGRLLRVQWIALGVLGVWTLGLDLWISAIAWVVKHAFDGGATGWPSRLRVALVTAGLMFTICLVSGLLAGWSTRSRRIMLICGAASVLLWSIAVGPDAMFYASGAVWHAWVLGAIVLWAVRERTRRLTGQYCTRCGYDLHGIEAAVCPECGEARRQR